MSFLGEGYSLEQQNQPELAITFLKQFVNVTEAIRQDISGLPKDLQEPYIETTVERTFRQIIRSRLPQ